MSDTPFHMDLSDKGAMRKAIGSIRLRTGLQANQRLLEDYLSGKVPELLNHDKLTSTRKPSAPALELLLICAEAWMLQPNATATFDIYRSARIIPLLRALDLALARCADKKVLHLDNRIQRLTTVVAFDQLEAGIFEIICSSRYALLPNVKSVEFIPEDTRPRPDILVIMDSGPLYIECKKFDRILDYPVSLRNAVRSRLATTIVYLQRRRISAVADITFKMDPMKVAEAELHAALIFALESGVVVRNSKFSLAVRRIEQAPIKDCLLVPSPAFYSRYGYRTDEWQGIVNGLYAHKTGLTWVDAINWEFAAKWQLTDAEVLWRHRRLSYDLLFKGIKQLNQDGSPGNLHVWIERDQAVGNRSKELLDFITRLKPEFSKHLSWLLFNELVIDVTPEGRFDFVEHAHPVGGPSQLGQHPPVTLVFVEPEHYSSEVGDFGVGATLPPLDSVS
jgi:hypothetical protein